MGNVGLGFPVGNVLQMIGSDAVIGWGAGGSPQVSSYFLGGKVVSQVVSDSKLPITATSATFAGGVTTIFFTRTLMSGNNPITDPTMVPVIASSLDTADMIGYHGPCRVQQVYLINLVTGGGSAGSGQMANPLKDAHGALMLVGWGIFLVAGVVAARYGKGLGGDWWFTLHQIFQVTGFLMVSAAFTLSWIMTGGVYFMTTFHDQLGLTIMIIAYFQFFGGLLRPHKGKDDHKSTARAIFEVLHPWTGRILLVLSVINIFGGINIWWHWWVNILYAIIVATWILIILFCEFSGVGKKVEEDAYHAL